MFMKMKIMFYQFLEVNHQDFSLLLSKHFMNRNESDVDVFNVYRCYCESF